MEGEYLTDRLTDEAIQFIENSQDGPFFLYLPYYAVHTPLQAPENLIQKYRKQLTRDSSQKNAIYGAMVERIELYNLSNDVSEQNNLADKMPQQVQKLGQKLDIWLESVDAKLHTLNPNFEKGE